MRTGTILIIHRVIGQARTLECRCPSHKPKDSPSTEYRCIRELYGHITVGTTTVRRVLGTSLMATLLPHNRASLLTIPTPVAHFPVHILLRTWTWDPVTFHCHTRTAQIMEELQARREYPPSSRESSDRRFVMSRLMVFPTARILVSTRRVGTTSLMPPPLESSQILRVRGGRP